MQNGEVGCARIHVKVLECDVVIRVRSLEQSLKDHKVIPRQEPAFPSVRDAKEGGELSTTYTRQVALGRDSVDELFTVQKPVCVTNARVQLRRFAPDTKEK